MGNRLSKIYTRTGDDGSTALGDASRTSKTDPRLAAYANVEEANAAIGVALALGGLPGELKTLLVRVQNDMFDVGADLCAPVVADPEYPPLRVDPSYIERLEAACDEHNAQWYSLRVGALDERDLVGKPARQIWTKRRLPWVPRIEGVPEVEGQP